MTLGARPIATAVAAVVAGVIPMRGRGCSHSPSSSSTRVRPAAPSGPAYGTALAYEGPLGAPIPYRR
jgi:hypothetical protein